MTPVPVIDRRHGQPQPFAPGDRNRVQAALAGRHAKGGGQEVTETMRGGTTGEIAALLDGAATLSLTRGRSFALRRVAVAVVAIAATFSAMFAAGAQIFASGGPL